MYANDVISVTDVREKMEQVIKKVKNTPRPIPVLAHNQVQFYIINNEEHELYQKLLGIEEMKKEVKETKKKGKYFDNIEAAMKYLKS